MAIIKLVGKVWQKKTLRLVTKKKSLITLTVGQRGPCVLPEVVQLLAGNGGTGSALEIGLVFPRNPRWTGRISTVDLLAVTNSDQLLFTLNTETIFLNETTYLKKEVNCTEISPSVRLP